MLGRVPTAARESLHTALGLDQQIFGFHAGAGDEVGQLGDAQLQRRDLRQTEVPRVERRFDDGEPGHQSVAIDGGLVRSAEKPFEIGSRAHGVADVVPYHERRATEIEPIFGNEPWGRAAAGLIRRPGY
jgi:hypothetical protein